jgi:hypothetical protein
MDNYKSMFANTISDLSGDSPLMNDCERYGMTWGCDEDCPVYQRNECKNPESIEQLNKLKGME